MRAAGCAARTPEVIEKLVTVKVTVPVVETQVVAVTREAEAVDWQSDKFNELMAQAVKETDPEKRMALYAGAEKPLVVIGLS